MTQSGHCTDVSPCPSLTYRTWVVQYFCSANRSLPPLHRSQIPAVIPLAEQRIWNRHDHSRASLRHLAFLHEQPQHAPYNQGDQSSRSQIFGNRHDCPRFDFPCLKSCSPLRRFLDVSRAISPRRRETFWTGHAVPVGGGTRAVVAAVVLDLFWIY